MAHREHRFARRTLLGGAAAVAGAALAPSPSFVRAAPRAVPRPAAPGTPAGPLQLYLLSPAVRVYDTRADFAPNGTDPITGAGDTRMQKGDVRTIDVVQVLGGSELTGVQSSSMGVLLNVVVVNTVGRTGWLRFWASEADEPDTASLNWDHAGAVTGNMVVSMHSSGYVKVRCEGVTGCSTDVVIDIIGYYDDTGV